MHCRIAARQLGVFTDFGGLQHFALEHADLGQPFPQPAKLDEPPFFLNQMIFYSSAANFRPSLWLGASVAHVLSHGREPAFGIQNISCQRATPLKRWTTLDLRKFQDSLHQ